MDSGWFDSGALPALKEAVAGSAERHASLAAELGGFQAAVERQRAQGEPAQAPRAPELVAAEMAENSLRHQALLRLVSNRYSSMQNVLREGR